VGKKIAVVGAGAIGSSVSADLTKAGYDVTVIDQWPAQVEAIRTTGIHVQMKDGDVKVRLNALHLCDLASARLAFDIVFLSVKSYDHRWLAEFIKPYLKSDGVLVGVMNGMNDDSLASIVGRERTVGCAVELSAEIFTPGLVQRNTTHKGTWFGVGELDGFYTPRVKEIEAIMSHVGRCDVTSNIYGAKWTKLIANTVWIAHGARDLPFALAHELAHLLSDSGEHSAEPRNLMRAGTSPENTRLTDAQCRRLRERGEANGLLAPKP